MCVCVCMCALLVLMVRFVFAFVVLKCTVVGVVCFVVVRVVFVVSL